MAEGITKREVGAWAGDGRSLEKSEIVLENGLHPTLMACLDGGRKEKEWRGVK